ncbi:hypothetical protein QNL75_26140, partial [Pseudomonas amygdali pv. morsprunorum]|nr:hypothetical protein [Pseudomonas amygdali pv. morsprunorum]
DFGVGSHHEVLAPEKNWEHSIKLQLPAGNVGFMRRLRCFHHEPLLWQPLYELHRDVSEVIKWIEPGLHAWIKIHDRVPATLGDWIKWRDSPEPALAESIIGSNE